MEKSLFALNGAQNEKACLHIHRAQVLLEEHYRRSGRRHRHRVVSAGAPAKHRHVHKELSVENVSTTKDSSQPASPAEAPKPPKPTKHPELPPDVPTFLGLPLPNPEAGTMMSLLQHRARRGHRRGRRSRSAQQHLGQHRAQHQFKSHHALHHRHSHRPRSSPSTPPKTSPCHSAHPPGTPPCGVLLTDLEHAHASARSNLETERQALPRLQSACKKQKSLVQEQSEEEKERAASGAAAFSESQGAYVGAKRERESVRVEINQLEKNLKELRESCEREVEEGEESLEKLR